MYYTVSRESTAETSIKHSKFLAFCAAVRDADEAELYVKSIKKRYSDATHAPYAYVIGERGDKVRASDDGEPSGTSGAPILDAIRGEGVTNTVVVVVRYFGGIKLGTGGLTHAYGECAALALRANEKTKYEKCTVFSVKCDYNAVSSIQNKVYSLGGSVLGTDYADGAVVEAAVPASSADLFRSFVADVSSGKADITVLDGRYCPIK